MDRIIKTLLLFSLFAFRFSLFANAVFADVSCQPIYGGGETCTSSSNILIDKKVLNPKTNLMVDNLGINDPKYKPGFIANFKIIITNTGKNTLSKVNIKDIFPQYVLFSSGPGDFDSSTKTLSFQAENIQPNESKTYAIIGRIVDKDKLPQGTVCVVNQAMAIESNSQVNQDNAQFCIENVAAETVKVGFPVFPTGNIKQTPPTGPESLALFSLIPTGILGWFLRKFDPQDKTMV